MHQSASVSGDSFAVSLALFGDARTRAALQLQSLNVLPLSLSEPTNRAEAQQVADFVFACLAAASLPHASAQH